MSKLLVPSLIAGVADNKKAMQAAALHALHQWVRDSDKTSTLCVESLLVPLSEGLWKAVGRAELLTWAVKHGRQCEKNRSPVLGRSNGLRSHGQAVRHARE
ncbi:hypothetical protein PsorP6_018173 [Peronosclerospora sorghi]|uniref:Uncharacterized protein n=1 Tax=Peronosclerospora sorghi TaxID=230839 RepID=A0ACC0WD77_9STRA|nr:hypothetical protein PsorP6_018173 [Peronosclerospora sorghi]